MRQQQQQKRIVKHVFSPARSFPNVIRIVFESNGKYGYSNGIVQTIYWYCMETAYGQQTLQVRNFFRNKISSI